MQLGIYLHRQVGSPSGCLLTHSQSTAEPFPPANTRGNSDSPPPPSPVGFEPVRRVHTLPTPSTDLYRAVSATPPVVGSPGPRITGLPEDDKPRDSGASYLDTRAVTKVRPLHS